jgi:hypothetical protein
LDGELCCEACYVAANQFMRSMAFFKEMNAT